MENKLLISFHFYICCNRFNRKPIRRLFRMLLLLVRRNLWWIGSHLLTLKTAPKQKSVYFHILQSAGADGILVPGGFGDRGVEGKILAVKYARENNVPFLGICLGMQIAIIEFARSVMNFEDANSTEFDPDTTNPCVVFMPEVIRMAMSALWMNDIDIDMRFVHLHTN
ncbi:hypothetical protein BHM03_00033321 [Ensete ventricosum]|nr:hypothetical protein BHM03_00033321 [Ensete ventricosum]